MGKSSIFSILASASPDERRLIVLVCLLHAICSSGIIGLPVWFLEPSFLCKQDPEHWSSCPQSLACLSDSPILDRAGTQSTLATELGLYCQGQSLKRLLLTMYFVGGFSGCLVNFLITIRSGLRKKALAVLGLIFGCSNLLMLIFSRNLLAVGGLLAVMSFTCMILNAYGFILINEFLEDQLAKTATIMMTLSWGVFGMSFAGFAYAINANWSVLFGVMGIIILIVVSFLARFRIDWDVKEGLSKAVRCFLHSCGKYNEFPSLETSWTLSRGFQKSHRSAPITWSTSSSGQPPRSPTTTSCSSSPPLAETSTST